MSEPTVSHAGRSAPRALLAALLASTALAGVPDRAAHAQDATWVLSPGTNETSTGSNWTGGAVPTGTATFGASNTTSLTQSGFMNVGGWTFASGAPAYAISNSGNVNFSGAGIVVDGAGAVITNSGGALRFANASSAGSTTIANNGYMQFSGSSTAGTANITTALGVIFFNDSSTAGGATITNTSTGGLNFQDSSTAGNAIIANSGYMQFAQSSTAGSAVITNGSSLNFLGSSKAGSAVITNNSGLYFYDSSTAGSAVITNNNGLYFSGSSMAGSAVITNNNGLYFSGSSMAGSAVITNNSDLGFLNSSTAGSAVITNSGNLSFAQSSTAGSAVITNKNGLYFSGSSMAGSAVITNRGDLIFFGSSTAANAAITNTDTGFLSFVDSSTAGAATITNAGNAYFNGASTAGSAIITNTGFTYFSFSSSAGSAAITNSGYLYFLGSSTTGNATITSNGLVNVATTDTAGSATVTIQSGGSLVGSGGVGNTTIRSGGTLQPSGTLTINGSLTLNSGATYLFTPESLASVTGAAALAGTLQTNGISASFQSQSHTVLTAAGGVSGAFTLASDTTPLASLLYGPNDVTLTITGYRAEAYLQSAATTNTRNVAAVLDRTIDASGGTPPAALNPLLALHGSSLANSLNTLSGEAATGPQSTAFSTASTFLEIMLDPMAGARGATAAAPGSSLIEMADTGMTPAARVSAGWSVWTKAFGQAGRAASDAGTGAAGTATSVFGVAAGADRRISPDTLVGFALAGGGTAFGLGGRGSGTGEYMQLGFYGSTRLGEGYLSAAIAYGWNRFDVTRRVGLGPIETYNSAPVAHTFGSRVEAGRRFGSRAFAVTPYAAVEAIGYASGGYRESWTAPATGAFALAYGARTTGTVRTELGLRVDGMRAVAPTADLLTFGRIAYAFQANTARAADASFRQLANSGFAVFGARASTHTMLATLGTEVRFAAGTRATASLDGELGDRHRSIRANVGLSHSW
jgi:uncharacterized protein with beta-barrel porin domain